MKNLLFFFGILTLWESGCCQPTSVSRNDIKATHSKFPNEKVGPMLVLPENQKAFLVLQFRKLCDLKSKESVGNQWTVGLKRSILRQVSEDDDTAEVESVKNYLTDSIVDGAVSNCNGAINGKIRKQGDDDSDASDSSGSGVYKGVEGILVNIASGNIFGIIRSSVGIRSPEAVQVMMAEIMKKLLEQISSAQKAISMGGIGGLVNGFGGSSTAASISGIRKSTTTGTYALDS